MQWLWTVAVKSVLDQLQLTSSRRVWWVTSGLMGTIPIHAAGDYRPNSTDNTMSSVISSYISSFKALAYARQAGRGTQASSTRMLLVTTPGHGRKLDTSHETRAISQTLDPASITALSRPTPAEVLSQLPSHTFAHFACHGFALARDPARGGLLLVDDDGGRAILTIEDLNRTELGRARVAYLAACSTAETSSERLLDEAISLANAFQTAGFRHVVGTLWDADDYAAGKVAEGFYGRLFEAAAIAAAAGDGDGDRDAELGAAKALHESVLEYRGSDRRRDIRKWDSFVYIGV
ncbi:hypothetical protein BK809_0007034 [Diplodia seriata]|uniref:CHAT domain-containing protein n=1 Tax=Diplodia seriata TaxID=420778 RepID=A0A1S8BI11_9PEZI|nr:hypothetical protein BK809_0007034 [Diplodia seriata]